MCFQKLARSRSHCRTFSAGSQLVHGLSKKIVTRSDIDLLLTCLRQRNNLPTDQVLVIRAWHGEELLHVLIQGIPGVYDREPYDRGLGKWWHTDPLCIVIDSRTGYDLCRSGGVLSFVLAVRKITPRTNVIYILIRLLEGTFATHICC